MKYALAKKHLDSFQFNVYGERVFIKYIRKERRRQTEFQVLVLEKNRKQPYGK